MSGLPPSPVPLHMCIFGAEQGGIAALAALILKFVISTVKKVKTP